MATKELSWKDSKNELRRQQVHRLRLGRKCVALVCARSNGWEAKGIEGGVFTWSHHGRHLEQTKTAAEAWARAAYNVKEGADL